MPIEPLPLPAIPPAPSRADPATFEERNDAAVEFQFNTMPPWIAEQVSRTFTNATESAQNATNAAASATAAAGTVSTVENLKNQAAASAASAAADAVKTAADRQAVEQALIDGPVLSVNGDTGVVSLDAEDVGAVAQGGSASLSRYDLASGEVTDTLDLAVMQVFRIDATTPRTLAFSNEPGADRAMTVVIHITGNSAVVWPEVIDWDAEEAPELGDNFTRVVLFWDGEGWSGFVGAAR